MFAETIKRIKTGLLTMNASLIKFAVAVLASVVITGCGGGSSAQNADSALSEDLPIAVTTNSPVNFSVITDDNLANCIKDNKINHVEIQVLVCSGKDIVRLDGIEQFSNLRVVDLSNNNIQNIQPLTKLPKLFSLDVSNNKLQSLNGLESLSVLNKLNVSSNKLTDADVLQEVKSLKKLYISNNQLQSLAFITHLNSLENLDAEDNQRSGLPTLPTGIKTFNI